MRRSRPHPRAGSDLNRPDLNCPDLNCITLEKIMEWDSHRIERPPPCVFAEAVARAHEGLNGVGQGRKLAW